MWGDLIYDWMDVVFALIIGGVVPGILLYVAFGINREARAAKHWTQTTGTVLTNRAEARTDQPYTPDISSHPIIEYEYKVGNRSFRGWGITIANAGVHQLKQIADQYPVGAKVVVRYNPADPQKATLEGDVSESMLLGRFLMAISVIMPFMAFLVFNKVLSEQTIFTIVACSLIPVGLIVAMTVKYREIRAASRWLETTGTVIVSCVESRKKRADDIDSDTDVTNAPKVVYEYQVGNQLFRCCRITIGERTSEYELESILNRYSVGAQVVVYYDPANPEEAVLERDVPASTFWVGGGCVLLSIAVPVAAILIYNFGLNWFNGGAIVLGGMGLATFGLAIAYTGMAVQASRWPTTRGRIVAAEVDAFRQRPRRIRTYFKPSVLYTYEVNGRQYLGDRILIGVVVSSTIPWLAGRTAAKYPVGGEVIVHYNPLKPSESVLHPWSIWVAVPWLIFAGLIGLGWALGADK
jgi:hypothetical protein